MFDEAKVKEQPMQTARAILSIADIYTPEVLEKACDKALRQYHMPYYKTIYSNAKSINSEKELTEFKENNKKPELSEVRIATDKPAYQKCLF